MKAPQTQYVAVGDAQVAYQVLGTGPVDLLWCYGLAGHLDLFWLDPLGLIPRFLEGLASFCRLVLFDRRGVGASDVAHLGRAPAWEELVEDMTAVLEAVGSKQAAVMANLEAGPSAMLFAAMFPERVSALILRNTMAFVLHNELGPLGPTTEAVAAALATQWGTEELARIANPGLADNPDWIRYCAMVNRASATPRSAAAQMSAFLELDLRPALPLIKAPTLVLHTVDNPLMPLEHGRYLANNIPRATLIEVPGSDIGLVGDDESLADIAEFLTGQRPPPEVDRVLTTMLFTDIVGSTERAASMGDTRWRALIDAHDRKVREQLERFRGREVHTTGDGFLASFDGLLVPFDAQEPSSTRYNHWASKCGLGYTRVSVRCAARTLPASRFISPLGWVRWRAPVRSLCLAPSKTWLWDRISPSRIGANINSRVSLESGVCSTPPSS